MNSNTRNSRNLTSKLSVLSKKLISAAVLSFALGAFHSVALAQDVLVPGDIPCPSGYSLISPDEARANQTALCNQLGTWDIIRLAGGGSMDGPGYGCGIRDVDTRPLGGALCQEPQAFYASDGDGVCEASLAPVSYLVAKAHQNEACMALGTWYIARLADGGSMDGPGYNCNVRSADSRPLGHSLCASFSFTKVVGDSPCPAGFGLISPDAARAQQAQLQSFQPVRLDSRGETRTGRPGREGVARGELSCQRRLLACQAMAVATR